MPDYDLNKKLGNGAFGEVWLVDDRALGVQRAIKLVSPHKIKNPSNFYEEPQTLVALKHDNIIEVTDAGRTATGELYIAMDYYPNGSISDFIKGGIYPLSKSLQIICDVCRALEYAHNKGYIHRDIKPANIILDNNHARLSDFGLATKVNLDGTASPYGYLGHLAPEVINKDITDKRTDIYALGITLYRLINGDSYLPTTIDPNELLDLIKIGKFPNRNHYRPFIPSKVKNIINKSLEVNPKLRYQTAIDFRHDIEKLKIYCDWMPKTIVQGTEWYTKIVDLEYLAQLTTIEKSRYNFYICKGKIGKDKRKIINDCKKGINKSESTKHVYKILTRICNKGK